VPSIRSRHAFLCLEFLHSQPGQYLPEQAVSSLVQQSRSRYLRLPLVIAAVLGCLFVIQSSVKYGASQLLITYSLTTANLYAATTAVRLTPTSYEAHYANAAVLTLNQKPEQAVIELERAVALRPTDHGLWSELGLLRDQLGDAQGALSAFNEAVKRAPYYSQPRWNRGNVLLRSGQYEAAFQDLSNAAASNPALLPNLMGLAWSVSKGDMQLAEQLAQINSNERRIALTRFLTWKGEGRAAVAQYALTREVPSDVRREMVDQLLAKGAVREAFEIWKSGEPDGGQATTGIYDAGFEGRLSLTERGFGWRISHDQPTVKVSVDAGTPHSGSKDLRIDFNGNSNPGIAIVSQLVLVDPSSHYKLSFVGRSQEMVSGGLPIVIAVHNAKPSQLLGRSATLAKGSTEWLPYSFEFTTPADTNAILLNLVRENCTTSPCPSFGSISLDSFYLQKVK
jgi:tetratricopeptide (TPR) repeat protein